MRLKHYEGKQRVCIANSVGPIAHLGWTETLQSETQSLQSHLGETEIPIGRTELLGFGSGLWQVKLGGAG